MNSTAALTFIMHADVRKEDADFNKLVCVVLCFDAQLTSEKKL